MGVSSRQRHDGLTETRRVLWIIVPVGKSFLQEGQKSETNNTTITIIAIRVRVNGVANACTHIVRLLHAISVNNIHWSENR